MFARKIMRSCCRHSQSQGERQERKATCVKIH